MNKLLTLLNVTTLVVAVLALAYLLLGGQVEQKPGIIQLSDSSSFEASILQCQSETIKQNKVLTERILVLESKLDFLLADLKEKDFRLEKSTDNDPSLNSVIGVSELVLVDQELLDQAESLTTSIISSGTLTIEQSEKLMNVLIDINDSPQADMLRRQIIVSINNDEIKIEPGAFF